MKQITACIKASVAHRKILILSFLCCFIFLMPDFIRALLVTAGKKPLTPFISALPGVFCTIGTVLLFYFCLLQTANRLEENHEKLKPGVLSFAAMAATSLLHLFLVGVGGLAVGSGINKILFAENDWLSFISVQEIVISVAVLILLLCAELVLLYSMAILVTHGWGLRNILTAFRMGLLFFFRHILSSLLILFGMMVLTAVTAFLYLLLPTVFHNIGMSALLGLFYTCIAASAPGYLLVIFLSAASVCTAKTRVQASSARIDETAAYMASAGEKSPEQAASTREMEALEQPARAEKIKTLLHKSESACNRGILSYIVVALFIVIGILLNYRTAPTVQGQMEKAVRVEMDLAQLYLLREQQDISGYHYKRAYSLCQAAIQYTRLIDILNDPSCTADEKKAAYKEFDGVFGKRLVKTTPSLGFVFYLQAQRYMIDNRPAEAIPLLESSRDYLGWFPNVFADLMKLYSEQKEKEDMKTVMDEMILHRHFASSKPLVTAGKKELKRMVERLEELSSDCLEKLPIIAIHYYSNRMYDEAMAFLKEIEPDMPDSTAVNFLMAATDLEMKSDGKKYEIALKAAERIAGLHPDEKWALEYRATVATKAGNTQLAENQLQKLYEKFPDDPDIAEQYAYNLILKNNSFRFTQTDQTAEEVLNRVVHASERRWFAHYAKGILEIKKESFAEAFRQLEQFCNLVQNDATLLPYYDNLYYVFVLKYIQCMDHQEAIKALDDLKQKNLFAWNYTYGTYYWNRREYDKAQACLESVVQLEERLSKPYFLLGNVHFERSFKKKNASEYIQARDYYQKSLSIFTEDPFCWFSLGHVYKNMGQPGEAIAAFNKVLFYMPEEDHRDDYWGVSIHATLQIRELRKQMGN